MKFDIIALGAYSFSLGLCSILDNKAAERAEVVSVPPYSSKIRQTYSLSTSRVKDIDSSSDLSPVDSVKVTTSEPMKLFRRGNQWSSEEDRLLLKLREERMSWAEIRKFFPERSWGALSIRYYIQDPSAKKSPKKTKPWAREEDELLLELIGVNVSWKEIAENFPGRSVSLVRGLYRYLTKGTSAPESATRVFTAEEDELLLELAKADIPWKE